MLFGLATVATALMVQGQVARSVAAPAGEAHLPDLTTEIPLDEFSIVGAGTDREFRYTHLVVNEGEGPLRIRPSYRPSAGAYYGHQELMTHDGSGEWSVLSRRRMADAFFFHAPHGHFHFPLASFGLYQVAADGGFGAPVRLSPKNGFCIADSYLRVSDREHSGVGGGWWGNCADPTTLRGISVDGADEYDYRDPGQSVPIEGVPDGTYWFRAVSDPFNGIVESDESNNEMDVMVTLDNGTVTAGATRVPDTSPCGVRLSRPGERARVSGAVRLTSATSVGDPRRVSYLVDGRVVGSSAGAAPYAVLWRSDTVVDGGHWLAARVTDGRGRVCTSGVVGVVVDNASAPDRAGPQVRFVDPRSGATVGGRVAVSVTAVDASGVRVVRFLVDGRPLGRPRTAPPYALVWNARSVTPGRHRLMARASDRRGNVTTRRIGVRVVRVARPRPLSVDADVVRRGTGTMASPAFSTGTAHQVLLALVSYDGPDAADAQAAAVSGAGLTWHLVKRSATQAGVSEIWAARAMSRVNDGVVTAEPLVDGFDGMLSVISFRNAARVGVAAAAGAPSGAPSFYLPAVEEGSRVFASGNDWDAAEAREPVAGQVLRRQWLDTEAGDTFWVQAPRRPATALGMVTIADTAPITNRWNYVGAEVVAQREGATGHHPGS